MLGVCVQCVCVGVLGSRAQLACELGPFLRCSSHGSSKHLKGHQLPKPGSYEAPRGSFGKRNEPLGGTLAGARELSCRDAPIARWSCRCQLFTCTGSLDRATGTTRATHLRRRPHTRLVLRSSHGPYSAHLLPSEVRLCVCVFTQAHQLTTRLRGDELKAVLPRKPLGPRTYRLPAGATIHIGALARIDVVDSPSATMYLTVWASADVVCAPALHMFTLTHTPGSRNCNPKADPRQTQDWFVECLQGGRAHPL